MTQSDEPTTQASDEPTAQAPPSHAAPTRQVPEVGAATNCWIYSKVDNLRVHRQPRAESEVVAQINRGTPYWASCGNYPGGHYTDCGGGNQWVAIWLDRYHAWFYVALACVNRYGP
jgi:hypothetical protein